MESFKDHVSRIERYIHDLSEFSLPIGEGVTRLAFSPQETAAINWAEKHLLDFGYTCKGDAFLNFHAYDPRKGKNRILVGTHVDTVKNGGKYDGAVGLVSFLEVLHRRAESGKEFSLPVDFVIFRAEESTLFKEALLGSKIATGCYNLKRLKDIQFSRDEELIDAMIHFGYLGPDVKKESIKVPSVTLLDILFKHTTDFLSEIRENCWFFDHTKEEYWAYFEIHIEQGKILELFKKDLGIVTSFRAPLRKIFILQGITDHSGTTPMNYGNNRYRRDALCAASECVLAIERICEKESKSGVDIVGTVGEITIPYSGINKIPGICKFSLDLRSNNSEIRQRIYQKIFDEIKGICEKRDVRILKIEDTENYEPVSLENSMESIKLHKRMGKIIRSLGYSYILIPSGAGHDAMQMAKKEIPVCMLFIPCKNGVSHSPEEEAKAEDISKASRVLFSILTSKWK